MTCLKIRTKLIRQLTLVYCQRFFLHHPLRLRTDEWLQYKRHQLQRDQEKTDNIIQPIAYQNAIELTYKETIFEYIQCTQTSCVEQ